ncbi:MAG: serine hydrolase, partial [Saprospiraceae bacterium]|nr:serine hydrolase [Saprospiraceae bacterium]
HVVMPESAVKKLFTPYVKEGPNAPSYYGYGWVVQQAGEKQVIWHNGGNGVFNAFMGFDLENDMCIVASSNTMKVITDDISIGITAIIDGKPAPAVEVRSADFDPMFENKVSKTAYNILLERGPAYFKANAETILKDAGFDFQDDMQLLSIGKHLEDAEKWEEGVALFETYTKLFPNIVIAWNRLGICRKNLGDKAGAKAAWEQSVKLRPNGNPAAKWLEE